MADQGFLLEWIEHVKSEKKLVLWKGDARQGDCLDSPIMWQFQLESIRKFVHRKKSKSELQPSNTSMLRFLM